MADDTTSDLPARAPRAAAAQRGEVAAIVGEMARTHGSYVAYFEKHYKLSREEAIKRAEETTLTPEQQLNRLDEQPPDQISWYTFDDATKLDPERAWDRWDRMKDEARDEYESGHRAASAVRHDSPWERVQYLAVRDSFIEEWQPRGGLELSLIDQMAQTYSAWLRWLAHYELLATADVATRERQINDRGRYEEPKPYKHTIEERALHTADRFQRMLRSLRALRDLRRYSPQITIHNRGQVNIGEQQVNVQGDPNGEAGRR